jgi:hypothetical protein
MDKSKLMAELELAIFTIKPDEEIKIRKGHDGKASRIVVTSITTTILDYEENT